MSFSINKNTALITFVCLLTACGTTRLPEDLTSEFRTRITEGGLKHFEFRILPVKYAAMFERGEIPPPEKEVVFTNGQRMQINTDALAKRNQKRLQGQIEKNTEMSQYCREGYWVIDSNFYGVAPWLRGECNDLATPDDRQKFPDTIKHW